MENIIKKLYELKLEENSFLFSVPKKEDFNEEWDIYSRLYDELPEKYKILFLRFVDLRDTRQKEENQASYEVGFKTCLQLFMQGLKD